MANTNSLYDNKSRYVHGGVTEEQNNRLEWWERRILPASDTDIVYAVERQYEGDILKIAAIFYGDTSYWWVIAQFNNILDPYTEIVEGRILRFPEKSRLDIMMNGKKGPNPSKRELSPAITTVVI